jgi:four helix bundle protein
MGRDPKKLDVFHLADRLVLAVYAKTAIFPPDERFGLSKQIRRAAVSVPTNIVEGCARHTTRDYLHFIVMATGSAAEVRYLVDLSSRLGFLSKDISAEIEPQYTVLLKQLQSLYDSLKDEP